MSAVDMRKIYKFYPLEGAVDPEKLPVGGDLYYECRECQGIVSSVTFLRAACQCGNLAGGQGTVTVRDSALVTVMRGKLK